MTRVDLPYLWINHKRGKAAAYYRRGGVSRRIRAADGSAVLPGDPLFLAAYMELHQAAEAPRVTRPDQPPAGSLAALVDAYRASPEWRELAPATRKDYDKVLTPLRAHRKAGLPVASLPRAFVFALRDEFATDATGKPTPRRANRVTAVLGLLLSWSVNRGWRKDNPASRPGRLRTGPGYRRWTESDVAAFLGHPGVTEPMKRAAAIGYYTGQRKADCLKMTKAARRWDAAAQVWEIEVTPEKTARSTRARLWLPEHPALTAILDAAPASDAVTLLTRRDGKPWKVDHFSHEFADAVAAAGLPAGSTFHGLRKALSASLAESGATDAEIDAVVHHSNPAMTRHYRAEAGQRRLARSAIARLPTGGKKG